MTWPLGSCASGEGGGTGAARVKKPATGGRGARGATSRGSHATFQSAHELPLSSIGTPVYGFERYGCREVRMQRGTGVLLFSGVGRRTSPKNSAYVLRQPFWEVV